jgi:deoxycytidylate deaminase
MAGNAPQGHTFSPLCCTGLFGHSLVMPSSRKTPARRRGTEDSRSTTQGAAAGLDARAAERDPLEYPLDDLRPDLVFGMIAPIGCNLDLVETHLTSQLHRFRYQPEKIKITDEMRGLDHPRWNRLPKHPPVDVRYPLYMDAGNCLREMLSRKDAMALLAVARINADRETLIAQRYEQREKGLAIGPDHRGYIINSLKTPDEIGLLRSVYGDRFIAISVYAPQRNRIDALASKIAQSRRRHKSEDFESFARDLVQRDQDEEITAWGQRVGKAFPEADFFIDAGDETGLERELERAFDLLFDRPYVTPTPAEYGMALAQACALRSADLGRQVGSVITSRRTGALISAGSNEVPRGGGGLYWPSSGLDKRDFRLGADTGEKRRRTVLDDTVKTILEDGWTPPAGSLSKPAPLPADASSELRTKREVDLNALVDEQVERLLAEDRPSRGEGRLLIQDIIEFGRSVHAEMAALLDAAMRGVSVDRGLLYTTTFPCHECARHVIAAGIDEVRYIEPYPKSLVADFHSDAIVFDSRTEGDDRVLFKPFVGIAPRRYTSFFLASRRKERGGGLIAWDVSVAHPREEIFGIAQGNKHMDVHARRAEHSAMIYREQHAVAGFRTQFAAKAKEGTKVPCLQRVYAEDEPRNKSGVER